MTRSTRIDRLVTSAIMVGPLALALFYAPVPEHLVLDPLSDDRCEIGAASEPVIPDVADVVVEPTPTPVQTGAEEQPSESGVTIEVDDPQPWQTPAPDFLFVMDGAVVLDHDADGSWGKGQVRDADVTDYWQWEKPARRKVLTPEMRRQVTAEYELFSGEGAVCRGTVQSLRVVTRASGDLLLMTSRTFEIEEDSRAFRNEAYAAGPWTLEGVIVPTSGDCEGALWAREVATSGKDHVYTSKLQTGGHLHARAQRLFAELPALHTMAGEYAEVYAEELKNGDVEAFEDRVAGHLEVRLWGEPLVGRAYVTVVYGVPGSMDCGDPSTSLAAVWSVDGDTWNLVNGDLEIDPMALLDRGGDGKLEIVGGRNPTLDRTLYTQEDDGTFLDVESVAVPFIGCPC